MTGGIETGEWRSATEAGLATLDERVFFEVFSERVIDTASTSSRFYQDVLGNDSSSRKQGVLTLP
jgi:hypothetical protein